MSSTPVPAGQATTSQDASLTSVALIARQAIVNSQHVVIGYELFNRSRSGQAHTKLIDTKTELFKFHLRRDRATRTLAYLSDITLNGNPTAKGWKPAAALPKANVPDSLVIEHHAEVPKGTRDILLEKGPEGFCKWILDEKRLLVTDTTLRDAHQSLIATRMRTYDMLRVAEAVAHRVLAAIDEL